MEATRIGGEPPHQTSLGARLAADLARAMHAAATLERERMNTSLEQQARAQADRAHERAAAEARQLRREADQDVEDIHQRCQALISRLRRDAEFEIEERRRRLASTLDHHASILETENESVRVAIDAYGAALAAFVERLTIESDPAEIARLAGSLPAPPDIEAIGADARGDAIARLVRRDDTATGAPTTNEAVGVMDPDVVAAEPPVLRQVR